MLNQSFSIKNFIKIFYNENRKGNYTEGRYFPELRAFSEAILAINKAFREKKKALKANKISYETYYKFKLEKNSEKELVLEKKAEKLKEIIEDVIIKISFKNFKVGIFDSLPIAGKSIYSVDKSPESFFVIKQIQKNLGESFNVKQADRFNILRQVEKMIGDGFPKLILRTDIESFYETIPYEKLKEKIDKNLVLSYLSKKHIKSLLKGYFEQIGIEIGIPRGVGISANLAEIYMQDIDSRIKSLPNVSYYARYVDDIVIIFTPNNINETINYRSQVQEQLERDSGLKLKDEKTHFIDLRLANTSYNFEFLGYKISGKGSDIDFSLSKRKFKKYKKQIDLAFEAYNIESKYDEKKARKLLVNRLRFLTGNTRLLNVKSNVLIGIYFSNILLTNAEVLSCLDKYFEYKISQHLFPYPKLNVDTIKLKERLRRFSFKKGFEEKTFIKFTKKEIEDILKVWKNVNYDEKNISN